MNKGVLWVEALPINQDLSLHDQQPLSPTDPSTPNPPCDPVRRVFLQPWRGLHLQHHQTTLGIPLTGPL